MALTDNIQAYWKLDGNSNDSVGSDNGTDTSISYVSGKIGNCADLERSTPSYITFGNGLYSITNAFTINAWVKLESTGIYMTIFSKFNSSYLLWYNNIKFEGYVKAGGVYKNIVSTTNPTTGVRYMTTFVYDGSYIYMYVNGSSDATAIAATGNIGTSTNPNFIGKRVPENDYFDGLIDEVGIRNRALSSTEISTLYNSGNGLTYPFTTTSIKTIGGLDYSSVKTVGGLEKASIKTIGGLA